MSSISQPSPSLVTRLLTPKRREESLGVSRQVPRGRPSLQKVLQPDLFSPVRHSGLPAEAYRRFVVIGDGGARNLGQEKITAQLRARFEEKPFASVLPLGDNVYEEGEPHHFEAAIEAPYSPLIAQGVRFYPVMGNHDVQAGFGDLQRRFWGNVPPYYQFRIGDDTLPVDVFAIDTTLCAPGRKGCHTENPRQAEAENQEQLAWLETALSKSDAAMKIVMGHYPLYTSGLMGLDEALRLRIRRQLSPLLAKNQVDLYLAGHEHHTEVTKPIRGTRHFLCGSSSILFRNLPFPVYNPFKRDKLIKDICFTAFEITPTGLAYDIVNLEGKTVASGLIPKKPTAR